MEKEKKITLKRKKQEDQRRTQKMLEFYKALEEFFSE